MFSKGHVPYFSRRKKRPEHPHTGSTNLTFNIEMMSEKERVEHFRSDGYFGGSAGPSLYRPDLSPHLPSSVRYINKDKT